MSLTNGQTPDDSTLVRYLVGKTSDEDTERFDELSIADDEFVVRLRAVEHDLVDAYVNGELTGVSLEDFKAQYLRSPSGLAKVEFSRALRNTPSTARIGIDRSATPSPAATPRFSQWGMAAAAALALAATTFFAIDDIRLRRRMSTVQEQQAALEQRQRQLQEEVNRQQAASSAAAEELTRLREELARVPDRPGPPAVPSLFALLLSPSTRDASKVAALAIPSGVTTVTLRLQGIADEFPRYEATLKAAGDDRVIWRSERLAAPSARDRHALSISLPTNLLGPRVYTVDLIGVPAQGQHEPVESYSFRVTGTLR